MEKRKYLIKLFDRISSGMATDEDIHEYNEWCQGFQDKNLPVPEIEEAKTKMLEKINSQIHHDRRGRDIKTVWPKLVAIASVIVLLVFGSYYLLNKFHKTPSQKITQNQPTGVGPGGNKATLTLANGEKVILDSVYNGKLIKQGISKVIKKNGGLLTYQKAGKVRKALKNKPVIFNKLTVPRGGQYQLILSDGTKVWLNAASSIRYPVTFTGKKRKVAIKGEVYMEVAKDINRPFIVTTRNSIITVLGTRFNIMAYNNEPMVKTTLLEGSVKVSLSGKVNERIIKPGQQASVTNGDRTIEVSKVNTSNVAAWIHGLLSLNDCSVKEFMNKLSRWYNVDIEYKGDVPQKKFGGMISRNTKLSDVLLSLETAGIYTKLEPGKIIVLPHKL